MEMLKGPRAAEAGIVYLQDQIYEFRAKENGKLWTVYGSPVCPTVLDLCTSSESNLSFASGLRNSSIGRLTMNGRTGKVPFLEALLLTNLC